jgi:iron complex outermembrane receptor protein
VEFGKTNPLGQVALALAMTAGTGPTTLHAQAVALEETLPPIQVDAPRPDGRSSEGPIDGWPGGPARDHTRSTTNLSVQNGTGSRLPGTVRDIPASVESINQATMQERGKINWIDALEGLTGITAAIRPGAAGVVSSRGFVENGFATLYDGIRVTSSTISTRMYDSFVFDRIEVLRGPASVLYGEGSVGGAVNLVRKMPSGNDEPFETLTTIHSRHGVRQGVGKGGGLGNGLSYRVDGVFTKYNGQVDDNEIKYGNITGALRWAPTTQFSSTLDVDYMKSKVDNAYWGTPLVSKQINAVLREVNYNNLPDNKYDDDVRWLKWKTEYEADSGIKFRNHAWSYQANRDWINTYRFAYIPNGGTCSFRGQNLLNNTGSDQVCRMTWENLAYDHRFLGDRLDAVWNGKLGHMPVATVIGAEVTDTRWDSPRSEVTSLQFVDPFNPDATDFFTRGTGRNQKVLATQTQKSVFGEGRIEVLPGVKIVGGFRKDWLGIDYDRQPANQRYSRDYAPGTYRVGGLWDVARDTTLYVQHATAVEPRFALFTLGMSDMPFTLTDARQNEIGIKQSFAGGRGEWTAAVYEIEKTNIPSVDANGRTVQVGKQSSRGIEFAASYRPSDRLRIEGNIAFVKARYDEYRTSAAVDLAGKIPPNVPERVANLGITWQPLPDWAVGGWLNYRSSITADDANTVILPGAAILDLFTTYRFSKFSDLTFRVRNVTDEVYAAWATDANYVILGNPRTYELTLRTRF